MSFRAEGAAAARDGLPFGANPYDPGARYAHEEWAQGWSKEQPRIEYQTQAERSSARRATLAGRAAMTLPLEDAIRLALAGAGLGAARLDDGRVVLLYAGDGGMSGLDLGSGETLTIAERQLDGVLPVRLLLTLEAEHTEARMRAVEAECAELGRSVRALQGELEDERRERSRLRDRLGAVSHG